MLLRACAQHDRVPRRQTRNAGSEGVRPLAELDAASGSADTDSAHATLDDRQPAVMHFGQVRTKQRVAAEQANLEAIADDVLALWDQFAERLKRPI